jgi:hypothetical protein
MRMVFLWIAALAGVVIVVTQQAERTWLAYGWVATGVVLAFAATFRFVIDRRTVRKLASGRYD